MSEVEPAIINPVEWDFKRFRCYRYLGIWIDPRLTKDELEKHLKSSKITKVTLTENPLHWIAWQRRRRPLIYIDMEHQCVKVPKTSLVEFDMEDLEHQASMVLRILKRFDFACFLRKRVDFLPSRIGYNEHERRQYHELVERGIERRLEIYGYAPIANRKMSRKRVDENKNIGALKRCKNE